MTSAAILGLSGPDLTADERAFFREADPWGFIVFGRNVDTPDRLRRLTGDLRSALGRNACILVDQEGGRVQRLRAPHWRRWMPPLAQVRVARDPVRAQWLRGRLMADELHGVGLDVNCAPTADVACDDTHPFLRDRCLGTTPEEVARNARALSDGMLAGGVLPVMKHMPGHGRGRADSHEDLPVVAADAAALERDFAPFRALSDLPMGMTAHVVYSALSDVPATQDATIVTLIRQEIGFDGLLMTDDLSMAALSGDMGTRSARAIAAGCDVILHCNGDRAEMEAAVDRCGAMTPDALRRAAAAADLRRAPEPADIAALAAELSDLLGAAGNV